MAEFHRLSSRHDEQFTSEWKKWNRQAEERAKSEPTAPLPDLNHLTDFQNVYEPAADTFLLIDALQYELRNGNFRQDSSSVARAVEIGCGTATPLIFLQSHWKRYLTPACKLLSWATDVNPVALEAARRTARANDCTSIEFVHCDLVSAMTGPVSIVIFNPPYVPTPDEEVGGTGIEAAWAGGERGRRVIDRAIPQIENILERPTGVAYLVTVDDNNPSELSRMFAEKGLVMRPLLRRRAFNEYLTIQKITWMENIAV